MELRRSGEGQFLSRARKFEESAAMSHLTERELVDVIDGALPPERQAHADACATCRGEIASLRAMLDEALTADVPEPSPLFWEHFSARVREGVQQATVERAPFDVAQGR